MEVGQGDVNAGTLCTVRFIDERGEMCQDFANSQLQECNHIDRAHASVVYDKLKLCLPEFLRQCCVLTIFGRERTNRAILLRQMIRRAAHPPYQINILQGLDSKYF